jgi:hypothetical protein
VKRRYSLALALGGLLMALLLGVVSPLVGAQQVTFPTFADPEFQETWERYDRPVFFGEARRSFTWGNQVSQGFEEEYLEGPNGRHLVQYFDKSRMEINNPNADRNNPFFVTNGLLALDMIRGQFQVGDATFEDAPQGPAQIPFGDLDDTSAESPTYASFRSVLGAAPVPSGQPITATLNRAGQVGGPVDSRGVVSRGPIAGFGEGTTNHSVASVFLDFLQQTGPVFEGGQNRNESVFTPLVFVTGLPISEAYWARVEVGAGTRDVLIQCFERRCLTYAPTNEPAFQVELANTGLQYFQYRYRTAAPVPPTMTPVPPTTTPTATPSPTPPADTTRPTIAALDCTNRAQNSLTIAFTTNEPATSRVDFGTTSGSLDQFVGETELVTSHSIRLLGLQPGTQYFLRAVAVDAAGNRAESTEITCTTAQQSAAPVIGPVTETVTTTSATLSFITDVPAQVQVSYCPAPQAPAQGTQTDPCAGQARTTTPQTGLNTSHSVTLSGLTPNTTYTYIITATSAADVSSTATDTVTTDGPPLFVGSPTKAPMATTATITVTLDRTATSATLTYTPAGGQMQPVQGTVSGNTVTFSLTGLTASTTYTYTVTATNVNGSTMSQPDTFTTTP